MESTQYSHPCRVIKITQDVVILRTETGVEFPVPRSAFPAEFEEHKTTLLSIPTRQSKVFSTPRPEPSPAELEGKYQRLQQLIN